MIVVKKCISSVLLIIGFFQMLDIVHCIRTKDKMYNSINGAGCFRRLNGTHQTGCSSTSSGSVGVLHLITTPEDFQFIINNPPAPPYSLILPPHLFTREIIMNLINEAPPENIASIVLINNTTLLTEFSHESKCPNQYSKNLFNQTEQCDVTRPELTWNPFGSDLLHESFPFPLFYISDSMEIEKLLKCFETFNNYEIDQQSQRSLCSIQINSFMSAVVNSDICMRRTNRVNTLNQLRFCDPLQGKNVFATLFPREIIAPIGGDDRRIAQLSEKFILITTSIDTTSLFDGVGLGATPLLSYATLISTAHTLAKLLPKKLRDQDQLNVLFMLFNGESYDYIGSQRFIYDLNKGSFPTRSTQTNPIFLDNIEFMIDIGLLDDPSTIQLYHYTEFEKATKFNTIFSAYSKKFSLNITTTDKLTQNLPPTSAQTFLRENLQFPVIILNSKPTNKFLHSIYDDDININYKYYNTTEDFTSLEKLNNLHNFPVDSVQIKIRNISSVLAMSIYELISQEAYNGDDGANPILIDEFLYCYLKSANCSLFQAVTKPNMLQNLPWVPPIRYISAASGQENTGWAYRLLGFLIGQIDYSMNEENCTVLPYYWFAGYDGKGQCRLTTQNMSLAYSPAFLDQDYDWASGKYSTWTESTWNEMNARIFLKPSKSHETLTLAIGLIVLIISFVFVFLINSRSDVLFGDCMSTPPPPNTLTNSPAQC